MKIYVSNPQFLIPKVRSFYSDRYKKLKRERTMIKRSEIMSHANEVKKLLNEVKKLLKNTSLDVNLSQPTYDEWVSKGYKQFTYKNWYFAVKCVNVSGMNTGGQWITVDCHHNSKNHNDTLLGESILRRIKELISYNNRAC